VKHSTSDPIAANQQRQLYRRHFKHLLQPLVGAGWEYDQAQLHDDHDAKHGWTVTGTLTRSCMVVNATWLPQQDTFQLEPVPDSSRTQATTHIRLTNMVDEVQPITRVSHSPLTEFDVEQLASACGLLEPTRFVLMG
jgi:hypothetical protein